MPKRLPSAGSDAPSTTIAPTVPASGGRPSAVQTANVSAARTAAIRIPTMGTRCPPETMRKRLTRSCSALRLAGVLVERRGQHGPTLAPRETLGRLGERTEPRALGCAVRACVPRDAVTFDSLRVPAGFA